MRRMLGAIGMCVAMACAGSADRSLGAAGATNLHAASPDAFAGSWRSVTAPLEFIRLTVVSKSSQQGVMGARLTFSGVAWEGSGRIDGDSLRLDMNLAGSNTPVGVVVMSARDAQTMRLQARPASANALDLNLVREN